MRATAGGSGKKYAPPSEGVVQAVCVDIIDIGKVTSTFAGETKTQHKIQVVWQIDERRDDGKRFHVSKWYTLSFHKKANLRKDIEAWRGKAVTDDEEQVGFELEDLKGWQCLLTLQHKASGENTYANVIGISPLMKNMAKMDVEPYERRAPKVKGETEDQADDDVVDDDIPF